MQKLHNKDFQIAFKTGSDANKSKFAKECAQGELYVSDGALYIAENTAGANDSALTKYLPAFGEAAVYNTEAALLEVILSAGYVAYAQDTGRVYISNGSGWAYYNRDLINKYYLSFDGVDDYLDAGNITALNSTSAFTISMWLNFEHVTGSTIMSAFTSGTSTSSRIEFVFNNTNELRFGVDGSVNNCILNISSPTDYRSTDAWHNIIGTYDGTNVTLFFDGSQVATTTTSVPSTTSSTHGNDTTIGRRTLGGGSFYFNGLLDEVAVFNSALSASDVTSIYNNGTPGFLSSYNPVGWWRMGDNDGGSGTTITDQGSGGNDATLVNGPSFGKYVFENNYSLDFDGVDDYLGSKPISRLNSATWSTTTPITMSAWAKVDSFATNDSVFGFARHNSDGSRNPSFGGSASGIHVGNNNNFYLWWKATQHYLTGTFSANTWYHFVFTWDGLDGVVYVNGSSNKTFSNAANSYNTNLCIFAGGGGRWNGYSPCHIDEIALWDSALSASDVQAIYNNGAPSNLLSHNPLVWYRMGDGAEAASGSTIYDESGNNNADAILFNGPTFSTDTP